MSGDRTGEHPPTSEGVDSGRVAALIRRVWCRRRHPWIGYWMTEDEAALTGAQHTGSGHRTPCRFCRGHDDEMPRRTCERERARLLDHNALRSLRISARIGPASRALSPGYGQCGRCRTTWAFVPGHSTTYERTPSGSRGMFPLCEGCWLDLGTAEARLPYYRALWVEWQGHEHGPAWSVVEAAVFDEDNRHRTADTDAPPPAEAPGTGRSATGEVSDG